MATTLQSQSSMHPDDYAASGSVLTQLEEGAKQASTENVSSNATQTGGESPSARPYDRAITMEELRAASGKWSLAGDAGLLHFLQDFSQRMFSRTHEIDKIVETLVYDTKGLNCKVQNTFNDFLMLSNSQFIENRVYDEEVRQDEAPCDSEDSSSKPEKTREQVESEVLPRFSQAVNLGLQVLDDAFITVEIKPEEESDDEDEDGSNLPAGFAADPIIEPKDIYADRPLPHLIGSAEFFHDETVGLIEIPSGDEDENEKNEEEEEESETETEAEKSEEEVTETESEETESSEEEIEPVQKTSLRVSDSGSESDDEDLFGQKQEKVSNQGDQDEEPESKYDLQAELAAKLGIQRPLEPKHEESKKSKPEQEDAVSVSSKSVVSPSFDGDDLSVTSSVISKRSDQRTKSRAKSVDSQSHKHKKRHSGSKKHQKKDKNVDEEDEGGLFGPPVDSDAFGGESPFKQKGGLFSGGGTLFDDNEEEEDLFGNTTTKADDNVGIVVDVPEPVEIKPRTRTTSTGKKLPAGAVSIFGASSPLFGSQPSTEEEPKVSAIKEEIMPKQTVPPPIKGLFDDDDEEDDSLFDQTKSKEDSLQVETNRPRKKTLELFDDDEEDELFSGKVSSGDVEKNKIGTQGKKIPVGGRAVFGAVPVPIHEKIEPETVEKINNTKSDLFSSQDVAEAGDMKQSINTKEPLNKTKTTNVISLFDNDDEDDAGDDLFSSLTTSKVAEKPAPSQLPKKTSSTADNYSVTVTPAKKPNQSSAKKAKAGDLFDDDDDDLFSTPTTTPQHQAKETASEATDNTVTKKEPNIKSLFDADKDEGLFGENQDLFPSASKVKEPVKPINKEISSTEKPEPRKTKVFLEESDEEDLFASKSKSSAVLSTPSITPSITPSSVEKIGQRNVAESPPSQGDNDKNQQKTSKKKLVQGLFEDDDHEENLFSSPASDAKTVVASETATKTVDDSTPNDNDFEAAQQTPPPSKPKKPVGAVSLFGGIDPFSGKKNKFGSSHPAATDDTDGVKSGVNIASGTSPQIDDHSTSSKLHPTEPKNENPVARSVGQLQKSLNLNPATLLPGLSPPKRNLEESGVSFDQPAIANPLENTGKDRVRVQAKRRPPSRGARRIAAQQSSEELFPSMDTANVIMPSQRDPQSSPANNDLIFGPPSIPNFPPDPGNDAPDGLFEPKISSVRSATTENNAGRIRSSDIFQDDDNKELFGTENITSKTTKSIEEKREESLLIKDSLFGTEDASFTAVKKNNNHGKEESKSKIDDLSDEDLFSNQLEHQKATAAPSPKIVAKETQKKSAKKPIKKWNDDDLFGESGSIFDDIPSKSKAKKKKKVDDEQNIFADSGDIFRSTKASSEKKSKTTKKKTEKAAQSTKTIFDESAPSIFDDPLNALGGD